MKKLVIVFIFIMLFSQFVFSGEINVSSFIGGYIGYSHIIVPYYTTNYTMRMYDGSFYEEANVDKFNYLLLGTSVRYGLSNTISDNFTLYFLGLLDLGLYINLTKETWHGNSLSYTVIGSEFGEIMFGGEIKARYKNYFFGLGSGMGLSRYLFIRPSFGYTIKLNLLLDAFVGIRLDGNFRLGFTFSIFK